MQEPGQHAADLISSTICATPLYIPRDATAPMFLCLYSVASAEEHARQVVAEVLALADGVLGVRRAEGARVVEVRHGGSRPRRACVGDDGAVGVDDLQERVGW